MRRVERADSATRALQRAIDACHAKGGGTAYVPPGDYTTGTLELKDNVTLYLEAGATLFVSQDPAEFPGMHALIHAEGARRIALRGRGRIDGQARYEWGLPEAHDVEIEREQELARRAGVDMRRWLRRGLQALTVVLVRCRDVLVEDVTIENSTLWAMRLWGCDGVVVRGVTITSDLEKGANSDGDRHRRLEQRAHLGLPDHHRRRRHRPQERDDRLGARGDRPSPSRT